MAVHDDVDGIEVTVLIDGEPAKEYDTENDDSTLDNGTARLHEDRWTVTKYIESVSDTNFSVKVAVHPGYQISSDQVGFMVLVDGVRAWEPLATRESMQNRFGWSQEVKGITSGTAGGAGFLRKFKFSKIETMSDGSNSTQIKEQANRMSKVGEIKVKVYRYDAGREIPKEYTVPEELKNNYASEIHEKALKGQAKSHGTSIGQAEPTTMGKVYQCKMLDGADYPVAIFKFKYRSNDALKQLLVLERTPEPEVDLLDGLNAEERQEVQDLAERLRKKRRNPGAVDDDFIKSEDGSARQEGKKVKKIGKNDTIDLTGDSKDDEDEGYNSTIIL